MFYLKQPPIPNPQGPDGHSPYLGHLKSTHFSSSLTYEFHNFDKELYGHNNHALFFPHMCGNREEDFLKFCYFCIFGSTYDATGGGRAIHFTI